MVNYQGAPLEEQVKILLEKNLAYSKEIYTMMKKIQRYILLGRIISFIYIILIVAPIILGLIYLPSILKGAINNFLPANLDQSTDLEGLIEGGGLMETYKNILDFQQDQ
ncbi:hypothetical protein KJ840_00730 [Patescibacteria group bacterium]|nr:hypothetical protein [Patescibacteria group bacterium]